MEVCVLHFHSHFNPKKKSQTHTNKPLTPPRPQLRLVYHGCMRKLENVKFHLRLSLSVQLKSKNSFTKGGNLVL